MSTAEFIQIIGTLVAAFTSVIIGFEQKLIKKIKSKNAITLETAIKLSKLNKISQWRLSRLQTRQIVHKTQDDKYYYDKNAHSEFRKKRIPLIITIVLLAVSVIYIMH